MESPVLSETNAPLVREVNLTTARNLSPLFDEAVRKGLPVMVVRGRRERGLLLSRETLLRALTLYQFTVSVLPEDDGGYTLWLRELNIAGTGADLRAARQDLLAALRSYVTDYWQQFDFYRHLPDLAAQEPYVLRLSLAKDDAELVEMLFGAASAASAAGVNAPSEAGSAEASAVG